MLTGRRASKFIRRFGGPGDDSGIVCFRFWQLVPAGGCPYRCAYCFLQTTPWFRFNPDQLNGLVYTNVEDLLRELDALLEDPIPKMMIVGELQNGLVFEKAFKKVTGKPLTHWIIPKFAAQSRHRLIFLTKSTQVQHALELELELEPTPQALQPSLGVSPPPSSISPTNMRFTAWRIASASAASLRSGEATSGRAVWRRSARAG